MDRFRALCNVAVELAKRDDDTSGTVFAELTALASQLGKEWENRLKELPKELLRFATDNPFETALAEGLTRAGRLTDAEAVARSVSPHVRLEALRRRMVALAQARDTRAAVVLADIVALVQTVDETPVKSLAERLGVGLAKAGYAAEAQRAIVTQKDNHVGIRDVAVAMAGAGYLAEATALAESVDPVLPTVSRELIMYSVATGFARTGQFDQAAEAARGSGMFGDLALADIVEALVKAGHADTAVSIVTGFVRASSRPSSSSMLLRRLATAFENREDDASKSIRDSVMEELKNCVETIPRENEKARVEAGAQLAIAFARLRLPGSDKIFADTIDAARSISNDLDRDQELSALVTTWADAGHFDRAREMALSLDGPRRDETLERLSATLAEHEQVAEAMELAATIERRDERLEVLADLLARQGRLREALDTLRARDPHHFAVAVAGWAPWLEKYGSNAATTILRDALGILAWANPAYGDIAAKVFPPS
jgi:hypothetical protein